MAEQKLSSGRFKEIQDELLDKFNASIFLIINFIKKILEGV